MNQRILALLKEGARSFSPAGPTIGEIGALAAGIRETLSCLGAPADEHLCLCLEGRAHLLAALIASWAGAPPLILPHAFYPRVLEEVREAKPFRMILADTAVEPPEGVTVIPVATCRSGGHTPTPARPPDAPFVWLFTGGSTGKPRIWAKTPENLFGEALHLAGLFSVGPADLLLSTAPPQHIYGLLGSVLLPFVAAARVLDRTCTFPREILAALREEGATVLVSVPIHYRALRTTELRRHALRLALSSAAPLDPADAAFFRERTGLGVTEIYGSTETGGVATRVSGENQEAWTPFSGLFWKVRAERLCVRSAFISPDLPRDPEGFFLTADRVEQAGENRFRFLGRADQIVKVAGKRVDLEEIREKILHIPGVRDAFIAPVPSKGARQMEIAALVAGDLSAPKIRAAIRSLEIPVGRPRRIRLIEAIPILPSGKIDRERTRQLLAAPRHPRMEGSPAETPPLPSSPEPT